MREGAVGKINFLNCSKNDFPTASLLFSDLLNSFIHFLCHFFMVQLKTEPDKEGNCKFAEHDDYACSNAQPGWNPAHKKGSDGVYNTAGAHMDDGLYRERKMFLVIDNGRGAKTDADQECAEHHF